jgi:hypothetical protein
VDAGDPISYLVLAEGTRVFAADGREIGTVEHVLADAEADVFDGLVLDVAGGHRFADATQVASMHERAVTLIVDHADELPEPEENPAALSASPDDTAPDDLGDKLKRAWDWISGRY